MSPSATIDNIRRRRQASRRKSFAGLGEALLDTKFSRQAFDLKRNDGDDFRKMTPGMHPGDTAMNLVFEALSQFEIPGQVRLRYGGMDRIAGSGGHGIEEGVIYVEGELKPTRGMNAFFTVPVQVRDERLLYPSILVTSSGHHRVIAQSTFDAMMDAVKVERELPSRNHTTVRATKTSSRVGNVETKEVLIKMALRGWK